MRFGGRGGGGFFLAGGGGGGRRLPMVDGRLPTDVAGDGVPTLSSRSGLL